MTEFEKIVGQLEVVASGLDAARRFGSEEDRPEGARWIRISDTVARKMADTVRTAAVKLRCG